MAVAYEHVPSDAEDGEGSGGDAEDPSGSMLYGGPVRRSASVPRVALRLAVGTSAALAALAFASMTLRSRHDALQGSVAHWLGLSEAIRNDTCQDTPGWNNGWVACNQVVNKTDLNSYLQCAPTGWTCKAYKDLGWCAGGQWTTLAARAWELGPSVGLPERNCCVCGGGSTAPAPRTCFTSIVGEACHGAVTWAMRTGIHVNPASYSGLTPQSSFEQFQLHLHEKAPTFCGKPCSPRPKLPCMTATQGSDCFGAVLWAKRIGIVHDPALYPGLSNESHFEDFQSMINEQNPFLCTVPCRVGYGHSAAVNSAAMADSTKWSSTQTTTTLAPLR